MVLEIIHANLTSLAMIPTLYFWYGHIVTDVTFLAGFIPNYCLFRCYTGVDKCTCQPGYVKIDYYDHVNVKVKFALWGFVKFVEQKCR